MTLRSRQYSVASSLPLAERRCGAGSVPTPSALGAIAVGFGPVIHILNKKQDAFWICTTEHGMASPWAMKILLFAPMKKQVFRPDDA